MDILINHCWCSDSIWGGHYDCRVILSINRIEKDKTYYDPPTIDWQNLISRNDGISKLNPDAINWLSNNIKDLKDGTKGWAIGTDKYNFEALSFSIFLQRVPDALNFIKQFGSNKKPIDYLNYFRDLRKKYNPKTKTLQRVS